jgi:hypothetical protein
MFNKASSSQGGATSYPIYNGDASWTHPAGHYCFTESIPVSQYKTAPPVQVQLLN